MFLVQTVIERNEFGLWLIPGGVDSEGRPFKHHTEFVDNFKGTWGTPRASERERAARMDQDLSAVVACPFEVPMQIGAKLVGLRGRDYIVTAIQPGHTHNRVFLREA